MSDNLHEALHSYPRSSLDELATKSPERKIMGTKVFQKNGKCVTPNSVFRQCCRYWKLDKKIVKYGRVSSLRLTASRSSFKSQFQHYLELVALHIHPIFT